MRIVIPGGSGQVGTLLARAFVADGHEVVVLSRDPRPAPWRMAAWDAETLGDWGAEFNGADIVINLAGHSVNCRYHAKNRRKMIDSRVNSTRTVGEAIGQVSRPPPVWLQASTATIYAHTHGPPNDEATGMLRGSDDGAPEKWNFSVEVATAWERALDEAAVPGTRKVKMRSAITLSPDSGGIFDTLLRLVRAGLGGRQGNGRQYVSWIHYEDFIRAVYWLIDRPDLEGCVNITAPNPLTNNQFMRELRHAWGAPIGLAATKWMLEIGAVFLRTEPELVLKSRRVAPGRLTDAGFSFRYPQWSAAASDLCLQWRKMRQGLRNAA